jgi:hypothetical protein
MRAEGRGMETDFDGTGPRETRIVRRHDNGDLTVSLEDPSPLPTCIGMASGSWEGVEAAMRAVERACLRGGVKRVPAGSPLAQEWERWLVAEGLTAKRVSKRKRRSPMTETNEVLCYDNGDFLVPMRAESEDGSLIGDGMARVVKGTPEWEEWNSYLVRNGLTVKRVP